MKNVARILVLGGILMIVGCKEKKTDYDLLRFDEYLEKPIAKRSSEVRDKILFAKSLYQNKQNDPVPLLIYADISKAKGKDDYDIVVLYYDEDKDLLGIGIQEKWYDQSGKLLYAIEDLYPNYVHTIMMSPFSVCFQGIIFRGSQEVNYKQMWEEYQKKDITKTTTWQETLTPPVVVSLPEKDKEIYVWLYDKKGNTSGKLKLELRENIKTDINDSNSIQKTED
jgi:hypothetical protein